MHKAHRKRKGERSERESETEKEWDRGGAKKIEGERVRERQRKDIVEKYSPRI